MKKLFSKFMLGRYGVDSFNNFLLGLVIFLAIINIPSKSILTFILIYLIMIYAFFRMFSKNTTKRYHENAIFQYVTKPIVRKFKLWKTSLKDLKNKYIYCPFCHQMIRLPRHKGEITVTCPKCQQRFDKRT